MGTNTLHEHDVRRCALMLETDSMITNFVTRACCLLAVLVFVQDLSAQQTIFAWSGTGETHLPALASPLTRKPITKNLSSCTIR